MHMHVCYDGDMRTTIELADEQRAALLAIAARRGRKGFSELITEAVDEWLAAQAARDDRLDRALRTQGALSEDEAVDLARSVETVRAIWRGGQEPRS